MTFLRSATVPLEIAHHSVNGVLHGHTLMVRAYTAEAVDLDAWRAQLAEAVAFMEAGTLESTVGRMFEDVALAVRDRLPGCCRVVIELPSRGHAIETVGA